VGGALEVEFADEPAPAPAPVPAMSRPAPLAPVSHFGELGQGQLRAEKMHGRRVSFGDV